MTEKDYGLKADILIVPIDNWGGEWKSVYYWRIAIDGIEKVGRKRRNPSGYCSCQFCKRHDEAAIVLDLIVLPTAALMDGLGFLLLLGTQ
ncbi:hypothetical protein ElyMa_002367300 [Elysia marginata]|uniref:Uncharacterized protein n=1 Tax=Elysia marginata TaxID=1093978 RepID=A0AAV4GAM1_9GAST|nr:hypothetical protein ElyMa_002367300 [Elysia marginata]